MTGAFVLPPMMRGMIEASAPHSPRLDTACNSSGTQIPDSIRM